MTLVNAQAGRSHTGNPHTRFDERRAASTVKRIRGSLRCSGDSFETTLRAIMAVCAISLSLSCAADQWWVGGESGDWNGNNWASEKGGTGAAWTSGGVGWFTAAPATIDLNGDSPSVARFRTSGFSADKRCGVNIVNSSATASVLTFSVLNRWSDSDFAFADMVFRNVAVKDTSDYGFEIFGGTHWYFGEGSSYVKPAANNNGNVYVGRFLATSNTLTIAKGATMNVCNDLFIGCAKERTAALTGVVYVAGTLKFGGNLYMGRLSDKLNSTCAGRSVLIVDGGTVETGSTSGQMQVGATYGDGASANTADYQQSEIVVCNGGLLNIKSDFVRYEYNAGLSIVLDGGTLRVGGLFQCKNNNNARILKNATTTVKNGGVLELGGTFIPNQNAGGSDAYLFDGGTFRAINDISVWNPEKGPADFSVGEGGMTIDTQDKLVKWSAEINKGAGKITKVGSGILNFYCSSSNSGGCEVKEGVLLFMPRSNTVSTRVNNGPLTVLNGGTLKNESSNRPNNGLADRIVLKEGATVSAPVDATAQCIFGVDIEIDGPINVAFDGELEERVDYPVLTKTGNSAFTDADAARCRSAAGTARAGQVRFRCSSDGKTIYARRAKGFAILFR